MMMLQQHEAGVKPPPDEAASAPMLPSAKLADRRHKGSSGSSNADQAQKCPRCDSLNTKFCYYNNYSLSQPRHFCKNCRRYWTKGGSLRNVPVGGGCRKNKRVKQRSMDPTSLASLDDSASNILANISGSGGPGANGATSLLPNFSGGPSSSAFSELSNENHPAFGLTFSRLQESMRIGEHSGAVPSSQSNLFSLGPATPSLSASLLSGQPSPILSTMPPFHPPTFPGLNFDPSPQVKTEPGALLFPGSDLNPYLMDSSQAPHPVSLATSAPIVPKLEDHLSAFSSSTAESSNLERYHQNTLALHVGHELPPAPSVVEDAASHGCNGNVPGFAEVETSDGLINQRGIKGKPAGSSTVDWPQGASESMFGSASEASLWTASWPEMHAALAGSTMAGALLH